MAKSKLEGLSVAEQRSTVMAFLSVQFGTPYWKGAGKLTADTRFDEDLSVSCLDMAMLIHDVEEEFGITMTEETIDKMMTFDDLINVVIKH